MKFLRERCRRFEAGQPIPTQRTNTIAGVAYGLRLSASFSLMLAMLVAPGCGGCGGGGGSAPVGDITLTINTEPVQGAVIKFNEEPVGESPVVITGVKPGPSLVEFGYEGYRADWETVRIDESPLEQSVTITMQPLLGTVTFESTPARATVILDGETVLGETPLARVKIPAGERTIRVEYENYEPEEMAFMVEPDFVYTKAFDLQPMNARLSVFSFPTGSSLWLNSRKQAQKTPVSLDLIPGTYRVGVHAPGYVMKEEVLELPPNADETLEFTLAEGAVPEGMVLVPAGEFTMGFDEESPDERPARTLMVEAYYIDKYEVTNEQFKEVFPNHTYKKGDDQLPVTGVTWEQATSYARAVGKRLPTEIEWEKAARGEDARTWPWGNNFDPAKCSHASGSGARLREVGSFPEGISPYGCFDMAGNAREWTQSWYQAYPGNTDVTAEYGQVYRVLRGGSYLTGPFDVRAVRRHYERMDLAEPDFGFRCAADVED